MKRIIISSVLVLSLCISTLIGATYALFTSGDTMNIAATSGNVEVSATIEKAEKDWIYSPTSISVLEGNEIIDAANAADVANGIFANKGTATINGNTLNMAGVTPGDKVNLVVKIRNNSNVAIKYQTVISTASGELADVMEITVNGNTYTGASESAWISADPGEAIAPISIGIALPTTADDEYQGDDFSMSVSVVAVQANASTASVWNGTVDSDGLAENTDSDEMVVEIYTAEELAALSASVAQGNTYAGYTVKLMDDIDLQNRPWQPIGYNAVNADGTQTNPKVNVYFQGDFDGQNHTIYNLNVTQPTTELWKNCRGLFGQITNSDMRNITICNANVSGYGYCGALVGYGKGTNNFDNIKLTGNVIVEVESSNAGGLLGAAATGTVTNIHIDVNEGSYVMSDQRWKGEDSGSIDYVGGVFAQNWPSLAENITSNMDVIGTYTGVGGIGAGAPVVSRNITSTGDVTVLEYDESYIGNAAANGYCWRANGLVWGFGANSSGTHTNCRATGTLTINGVTGDNVNGMNNGNRIGAPRFASSTVTIIDEE